MAYVMLSRVQEISQVIIIDDLHKDCVGWKVSQSSLDEKDDSVISAINVPRQSVSQYETVLMCLNVRSLRKNFKDVQRVVKNKDYNAICLQETWLLGDDYGDNYHLENLYCDLNSRGLGKGIATYFKMGYMGFKVTDKVKDDNCQITQISSVNLDIFNIYRSSDNKNLIEFLKPRINEEKSTILCGDFNINYLEGCKNNFFRVLTEKFKFKQLVTQPTHTTDYTATTLDQVWVNTPLYDRVIVEQTSVRFTDHDMLRICIKGGSGTED